MSVIEEKLKEIQKRAAEEMKLADGLEKLNEIRVAVLGKKGSLTSVLKSMKDVPPEERPQVGKYVNETRDIIEKMIEEQRRAFEEEELNRRLGSEAIDVTLPAKKQRIGHRHPNTIALEDVERIFIGMGYEVIEGPEIEYDEYNFTKLNIPANHPAKDEQDTFYITDDILLRTQTSPVQARITTFTAASAFTPSAGAFWCWRTSAACPPAAVPARTGSLPFTFTGAIPAPGRTFPSPRGTITRSSFPTPAMRETCRPCFPTTAEPLWQFTPGASASGSSSAELS